jgi:serine/threonine-protein kinase SRPK3
MLRSKLPSAIFYSSYYHKTPQLLTKLKDRLPSGYPTPRRMTNIRSQYSTMSSIEYCWIDGVERLELYEPGGYHPVMVNDLLHNRYRIVDKLGFGGYSTIWLARDEMVKRYVAVKIGISTPSLPRREPEILRELHGLGTNSQALAAPDRNECAALPSILDTFDVRGPNGTHTCYTLTPAQGNLKEASFSRLFPIRVARALAAKLTTAVAFVHSQGFVHGGWSGRLITQSL